MSSSDASRPGGCYQKFPLRYHNLGPAFHTRGIGESTGAFDLFTLEDTGALVRPPVSNRAYYPDIYETSFILLREEAGSVAFHAFPTGELGCRAARRNTASKRSRTSTARGWP